ncbi:MAG: RNA polymerase sigma factor [Polyangiaceae bacterium]|nr:RNA polymerase sigma factor [Polyangiaceae bacterium]
MSRFSREVSQLFDRYQATVYRRCRSLLGSEEAAQEAVQEVFLRVLAQFGRFRGDSSELTWIYSIATLYCLQQLRNQRSRRDKLAELEALSVASPRLGLEDHLALVDLIEQADRELQQIVVLRYVECMTIEEIAQLVNLATKTVTRRLQAFADSSRQKLSVREAFP